jgi:NitT/TauT family transport system ATP-binding protein
MLQTAHAGSQMSDAQLSIDRLKKVYETDDEDLLALNETSFTIGKGEFVSVLGPSGCGKSTLLLMAAGLERSSGGSVTIGGKSVKKPYTDIGIVFQEHALYEWRTVLENIMLQAEIRRLPKESMQMRAYELLEQTGLKEFANKYPSELSGGMRQRAAICRALVHDPSVLFFDEPFGALDALTREQMRIDLEKMWLKRRPTVLFITHGIAEAVALSDRIIVMTPRPGQVDEILTIDLPRPRTKEILSSNPFIEYCDRITESFMRRGIIKY